MDDATLLQQVEAAMGREGVAYRPTHDEAARRIIELPKPPDAQIPFEYSCYATVAQGELVFWAECALPPFVKSSDAQEFAQQAAALMGTVDISVPDESLLVTAAVPLSGDFRKAAVGGPLFFQMQCAQIMGGLQMLMGGMSVDQTIALLRRIIAVSRR